MEFYLVGILITFISLFILFNVPNNKLNNISKYIMVLTILFLYFLSIYFRKDLPDLGAYRFFYSIDLSWNEIFSSGGLLKDNSINSINVEIGFKILMKIGHILKFNFEMFCVFLSIIEVTIVLYALKKICRLTNIDFNIFLAILCFILYIGYYYQFIVLRQGISMCIAVVSLAFFIEGKKKSALLTCIISFLFHSSGIMSFFIILTYKLALKLNKKIYISLSIIMLLIFVTGLNMRLTFFTDFLSLNLSNINSAYSAYNSLYSSSLADYYNNVIYCIMCLIFACVNIPSSNVYWKYYNLVFLSLPIRLLLGSWSVGFRISEYCLIYVFFVSSLYLEYNKSFFINLRRHKKVIINFILILTFFYYLKVFSII